MRFIALMGSMLLFACTGGDDDGPAPGGADAAAIDAAAPAPDAAPATHPLWTSIDEDAPSCAAACAALGVGCGGRCPDGAGQASYGYFDWDIGITRIVETDTLASCEADIADSVMVDGESYDRAYLSCCCEVPEVTVEAGNPAAPATCDAICAAAGKSGCGDFYDWQNGGSNGDSLGGQQTTYVRPETGSVEYWVAPCGNLPTPTRTSGSVTRNLDSISCACF